MKEHIPLLLATALPAILLLTSTSSAHVISSLFGTHEIYVNAHIPDVVFTSEFSGTSDASYPSLARYSRLELDPGVVLGTHLSFDRLHHAERWCATWQGPMSVSVLVANRSSGVDDLTTLVDESSCLRQFAAIQLIWCVANNKSFHVPECCQLTPTPNDSGTASPHRLLSNVHSKTVKDPALVLTGEGICGKYPINVMRNAAMEGAAQLFGDRAYFFLVDIDLELHPVADQNHLTFSQRFAKLLHREEARLAEGGGLAEDEWRSIIDRRLWVVPAVETSGEPSETMAGFESQISYGRVTSFYGARCHHCYGTVDLPRFAASSIAYEDSDGGLTPSSTSFHPSSVPYGIPHVEGNEHFFVSSLKVLPPFVDVFFGRHLNKQQWHLELWGLGLQFYTLLGALLVNRGSGDEPSGALRYTPARLLYEQPTSLYEDCKFRLARIGRLAYYPSMDTPVTPAAPWVVPAVRQMKKSPLSPWSHGSKWAAAISDTPLTSGALTPLLPFRYRALTHAGLPPKPSVPAVIGGEELLKAFALRNVFHRRFPFQCVLNEADDTSDHLVEARLRSVLPRTASQRAAVVASIVHTEVDAKVADPLKRFTKDALKVIFDEGLDHQRFPRILYYQASIVLTRWWVQLCFQDPAPDLNRSAHSSYSWLFEMEERTRIGSGAKRVTADPKRSHSSGNVGFFDRCEDLKVARSRFDATECKACVPNQGLPRAILNRLILQVCAPFALGPLCDKAIDPIVHWIHNQSVNRTWKLRVEGDPETELQDSTVTDAKNLKSPMFTSTYDALRLKALLVLSMFHYLELPLADDPFALCSFNGNATLLPCSSVAIQFL
jgi:hypothetical protein